MNSQHHISTIIINNLKVIKTIAGVTGVRCFKAACFAVRCQGVDLNEPANLNWLYETPVNELDKYGIFAAINPIDGVRFFYLDSNERNEDAKTFGLHLN